MARTIATVAVVVGLAIAGASLLLLLEQSGLGGGTSATGVATWVVVFLVGIFLFGWGLGKRTGP